MPACSVIREARGDTATYLVSGRFEGVSAWELAARLTEEHLPHAVLDFSRCQEFQDYAVAVLSQALLGLVGLRVQLRGLRQHQERVFKCFGVDVAELAHPGEPARIEPVPELAREVV
ncbi:MAG TPA: hypothetical protein VF994_08355 [Myxococcales bacterium]